MYFFRKILPGIFYNFICPLFLLICLEFFLRFRKVPVYILPLPSGVAKSFIAYHHLLLTHSFATIVSVVLGFLLGSLIGILMAVIFFYFEKVERFVSPYLFLSHTLPKIAIAPILILWFGFGILMKIVIAAIMSLFPILVSFLMGLRSIPRSRVDIFHSLFATKTQEFFKLYLPGAMPFLFPALKTAMLFAVAGVIVGEFISSDQGLGYIVKASTNEMNLNLCFAALALLTAWVFILQLFLNAIQSFVLQWQTADRQKT